MRYTLRDLMVVVTFCASIAWCAAQVGFDNGLFWFIVGTFSFASVMFVYEARSPHGRRRALRVTLPLLASSFFCISVPIAIEATLLSLATLFFARGPTPSVRTLSHFAMATFLAALLAGVIPSMAEMHKLEAVEKDIPIVSLERRLQYEKRSRATNSPAVMLNASVDENLGKFENELAENSYRKFQLKRLHSYQEVSFRRAAGFGMMRMIPLTPDSLRRPPLKDIRFDAPATAERSGPGEWRNFFSAGNGHHDVDGLYKASRDDFLDPDSFGIAIEPRLKTTGFVEHGFHYPPLAAMDNPEDWTIERLELVSLLKFDGPRTYVLDHLPRMDQLSSDNVPTRPLNDFETKALARLRIAEDLVVADEGNATRMLGSLRAAKQCTECHSVSRGELLGAFSYVLHGPAVVGH